MATVTGYTAAAMDLIRDATIVDAAVVGDDLILEKYDGGTINAGDVRGATGATGATGAAGAAGLTICTSTTRPGSPTDGLQIFETDTRKFLHYYTAGSSWRYNPGQVLAFASKTTAENDVPSGDDFSGMSATFNALGGPVIVNMKMPIQNNGTAQTCSVALLEGATIIESPWTQIYHPTTGLCMHEASVYFTPASGSHTYKLRNGSLVEVHNLCNPTRRAQLTIVSA